MYNFEFKSISELVKLGREGREKLAEYLDDIQRAIGEGNELHPDLMDSLFDACDELCWDPEEFVNWMWRGGRQPR